MKTKPNRARTGGAPDWKKQIRFDLEFAKRTLLSDGSVSPMFIIHTINAIKLVPAEWETDEEKVKTFSLIYLIAMADDALAVSFISEVWVRSVPILPGESMEANAARVRAVPPSKAEDRYECLMVILNHRDDAGELKVLQESFGIERGMDGRPSGVSAGIRTGDDFTGRFAMMMSPEPPTADERELAQRALPAALSLLGATTKDITRTGNA